MKRFLIFAVVLLLGVLVLPAILQPPPSLSASPKVATVAAALVASVKAYVAEYGERPPAEHAELLSALRGENPKEIVFFECAPEALNANGELLDPWGTPFRITFTPDSPVPRLHSAGRDRRFDSEAVMMFGDDFRGGQPLR